MSSNAFDQLNREYYEAMDLRDIARMERREMAEEADQPRRQHCQCGDLPGTCPGPENCPMCQEDDVIACLPCPFCGDTDPAIDEVEIKVWAVVCNGCGCIGPIENYSDAIQSAERAIELWNERATDKDAKRYQHLRGTPGPLCDPAKMDASIDAAIAERAK